MRTLAVLLLALTASAAPTTRKHDVVKLADGVYAFVWADQNVNPEPNVLIVVNDDDVLVVDSSMYPSTSRLVIDEIRKLTPKPVRTLVNTHWHDDHVFGNSVYREAWPGVQIVAHENTRNDAAKEAFGAIPKDLEKNRKSLEKYRHWLETGKRDDGSTLPETSMTRLREEIVPELTQYDEEIGTVKPALPDLTFTDSLVLHRGARTIEIAYLGRGNTRGDVVVWLPDERILATGDLVVAPTPFGIESYYADWASTLDTLLRRFDARTYFLGHGAAFHDAGYVRQVRNLLLALVTRVRAEVAAGASLDDVQKRVTLADFRTLFAGDDALKQRAFDEFFVQPAVARAYHQLKGEPDEPS